MDIPHYRIVKTLGRGGMATVYLAIQESVQREVALKVMAASLRGEEEFSARFLREAHIAASLQHPNVVQIYDVGVAGGHHYIAMEYLPGGPVLTRGGQTHPPAFVLRVARQIAAALDYASERGVVHRDIKPDNILLREDGTAVLTDFGIARAGDTVRMTRTGAIVGTPHYMSPEQARGLPLDGRSDLYGLGIVLYEMLVGQVPYKADDSLAIGIMHVTAPLPQLPPALADLQPLLDRLLAKEPERRFQCGKELIAAIDALQHGLPIAAEVSSLAAAEAAAEVEVHDIPLAGSPPGVALIEAHEPRLGRLEDVLAALEARQQTSFDPDPEALPRTPRNHIGQEVNLPTAAPKPPKPRRNVRRARAVSWGAVLLAVLALLVLGLYVHQDALREYLPETRMNLQLQDADAALAAGRLDGEGGARERYLAVLAQDPDNQEARQGVIEVGRRLLEQARQALATGDEAPARALLPQAASLGLPASELEALQAALGQGERQNDAADTALAELLAQARAAAAAGRLDKGEDSAIELYRRVLRLAPDNTIAQAGLREVLTRLLRQAHSALAQGALEQAEHQIARVAAIDPAHLGLPDAHAALAAARRASLPDAVALLEEADALLASGQLIGPESPNAAERYRQVLAQDGSHSRARTGLRRVAQALLQQAEQQIDAHQFEAAQSRIDAARALVPNLPTLAASERRLVEGRYRLAHRARFAPPPEAVAPEAPEAAEEDSGAGFESPHDEAAASAAGGAPSSPSSSFSSSELAAIVQQAHAAAEAGRFLMPPGESAYDLYRAVLARIPDHAEARQGLASLPGRALRRFDEAMAGNRLGMAREALEVVAELAPGDARLNPARQRLARSYLAYASERLGAGELDLAERAIEQARALDPGSSELPALQARLEQARGG